MRERGIKCYVVTNQEKYRTEYLLKKMNFDKMFDGVFSSAHVGFRKPQQEFFQYVMGQLKGIRPDEVLFYDDSQEHVNSAKKLGMKAELFTDFKDFIEKMSIYVIKSRLE